MVCITEFCTRGYKITATHITNVPENMEQVCMTIIHIRKQLVWHCVAMLSLSETGVRWINFCPYKMTIIQELSESDKQNQLQFCRCFFEVCNEQCQFCH
jgi:hypothetical protein